MSSDREDHTGEANTGEANAGEANAGAAPATGSGGNAPRTEERDARELDAGNAHDLGARGSSQAVTSREAGTDLPTDASTTVEALRAQVAAFADARDWQRFHTPRNLAMAVSIEAAELLELYLWGEPELPGSRPPPSRERLEAELADVAICLLNLCTRTGVDLSAAIHTKLEHNARRYPVELARGNALKYDQLPAQARASAQTQDEKETQE
jgi:NTP pyrophosphatase (non-canonical NTP hydrolase)